METTIEDRIKFLHECYIKTRRIDHGEKYEEDKTAILQAIRERIEMLGNCDEAA